jgi:hypothetical protein
MIRAASPIYLNGVDRDNFNCGKTYIKVKLTLEQATKAQRGSRGITLLFL